MRRYWYLGITIYGLTLLTILYLGCFAHTLSQYVHILKSPSILLTDYISIAGIHATLLNVLLTFGLNMILIKVLKVAWHGPVVACLFTIAGFSFFGKNIYNALPIYLGIYLYARTHKEDMRSLVLVMLLSSGISPIVSYMIFGIGLELYFSIPLGILTGVIVGFLLPLIHSHALRFHDGYNLYATGFSMGLISIFLYGLLSALGIKTQIVAATPTTDYHNTLFIMILLISVVLIFLGLIKRKNLKNDYTKILKHNGRLIADFFRIGSVSATLLNMGILGILSLILVLTCGFKLTGPVVGAIFTVIGFGAFGKHPLNVIPVVLGALVAYYVLPIERSTAVVIALFFVSGLAPISKEYGLIAGLLAGFLHMTITGLALQFQGGFDLYNNGFAAGFVAAVIVPVFTSFRKDDDDV